MRLRPLLAPLLLIPLSLSAQLAPKPPDLVIPVVGSTRGQSNANFKTELQLANPASVTVAGWFVLQPQLIARRFELPPHTTLSYADIVADLGVSGLGSLDILSDTAVLPVVVARAFDDQPAGTTGVTVPAVRIGSVLARGDFSALIVPRDLTRYRFNIGVRTLGSGASLELTVYRPDGTQRHARDVTFGVDHFEQQPANVFAGTTLEPDESVEVRVVAGSAIVYATTVDNATNDSSIQVLTRQ